MRLGAREGAEGDRVRRQLGQVGGLSSRGTSVTGSHSLDLSEAHPYSGLPPHLKS